MPERAQAEHGTSPVVVADDPIEQAYMEMDEAMRERFRALNEKLATPSRPSRRPQHFPRPRPFLKKS